MPKQFSLLICCAFWLLKPCIGFAWSFTEDFNRGYYWRSFPFSFEKFVTNSSDGPLLAQLTEQAQQEWENAVGKEIWSTTPGYNVGGASGNHIRWSNNFAAETGYDPNTTLAVTIRYSSGTYFNQVVIVLNGENNALRSNSQGMLKKTILHELGHTIGLDHSQQYSIMGASVSSVSALTWDDSQGANAAIDEHLYRQQIGYSAPLSESGNETFAACGSVALTQGDDDDFGGRFGFVLTLLLGVILARAAKFAVSV